MALVWLGTILISGYLAGLAIARAKEKGHSFLTWLWVEIGIILAILSFFKFSVAYGAKGFAWLQVPAPWVVPAAGLVVPIGLSYVTFQMISYLVDVWKGTLPTLLMFHDSFGAYYWNDYLSMNFGKSHFVHLRGTPQYLNQQAIRQLKPDVIIIEIVERDLDQLTGMLSNFGSN